MSAEEEDLIRIPSVYTPVDVSTYSPIYPSAAHPKVDKIASLFTEWIRLLIDMHYLPLTSVSFPSHEYTPIDLSYPARFGLTKDVVDILQMIPHRTPDFDVRWNYGSDAGEFLAGGELLQDLRGSFNMAGEWSRSWADPFHVIEDLFEPPKTRKLQAGGGKNSDDDDNNDDEHERGWDHERGPYMRPWYVPLSDVGNHGSVMVLDTRRWEMWLIDASGKGSTDPVFSGTGSRYVKNNACTNRYDLLQYPSRPATDFLNDVINRFRSLEWMPGGLYGPGNVHTPYKEFKGMYTRCGWPLRFDPLRFARLLQQHDEAFNDDGSMEDFTQNPIMRRAKRDWERLYDIMADEREAIKCRIIITDAKFRLAHKLFATDRDRETLEFSLKLYKEMLDPPPRRWKDDQGRLKDEIAIRVGDLEELLMLKGRYKRPGWAGVSVEELDDIYRGTEYDEELLVLELEARVNDTGPQARREREYREAKAIAAEVPEEIQEALLDITEGVRDDGWSILGTGNPMLDIEKVIREDMTLKELSSYIVHSWAQHGSSRGEAAGKIWRNEDGRVMMHDLKSLGINRIEELDEL